MTHVVCGVDVSAEALDARIGLHGPFITAPRSPEGCASLKSFCDQHGVELVVMEATGGYEKLPYALLWEAGVACAILNPRAVRRFAEAMGYLEKTDRIDAGVMAYYAKVKSIVPQKPPSEAHNHLKALVIRLRQVTQIKVDQTNQRRLIADADALASIDEVLCLVRRQIKNLEAKIAESLNVDPLWRELDHAFREIKGVADRTVASLMAELPEVGEISNKAAAKLVGIAPIAKDSGKRHGKRSVRGGRASVRSILFIVASVVGRHDPDFKAFRERLIAQGKPPKVVRIAVAHKLLTRLNAKARDVRKRLAHA